MTISRARFLNTRLGRLLYASPSAMMQAAQKGFSPEEMEYLRKLSAAPMWRDFDRVARAPAMDMVGGQFRLPFSAAATMYELPIIRYATLSSAARAAVLRAAYHLAIGQRDSAEAILRSIVSFGFSIGDNGPGLSYQNVGRSAAWFGMSGLEGFYAITHDPRAAAVRTATRGIEPSAVRTPEPALLADARTVDEMRRELIRRAEDPRESRGVRFSSLELLSMASCTNVREMFFGPRADVREAFDRAKRDLARYLSEQAYIELMRRAPASVGLVEREAIRPLQSFLIGASTIAGTALHNPRLTGCTLIATNSTVITH